MVLCWNFPSKQEGLKAIEVAVLRGYREGFNALRTSTVQDPIKPEWSIEEHLDEAQVSK